MGLRLAALLMSMLASAAAANERLMVLPIAAPDQAVQGLASQVTEQLLTELQKSGHQVLGQSDLTALLGVERQRQLLGCDASSSQCLAELSGALGARYLVQGTLARAGAQLRLDLKLLDTAGPVALAREGEVFASDGAVFSVVARLAGRLIDALPREAGSAVTALGVISLAGAALGLAAVGLGGGLLYSAADARNLVEQSKASLFYEEGAQRLESARGTQKLGGVLLGAGAAMLTAGVVVFLLFGRSGPVSATVSPVAGGAIATVGGAL